VSYNVLYFYFMSCIFWPVSYKNLLMQWADCSNRGAVCCGCVMGSCLMDFLYDFDRHFSVTAGSWSPTVRWNDVRVVKYNYLR